MGEVEDKVINILVHNYYYDKYTATILVESDDMDGPPIEIASRLDKKYKASKEREAMADYVNPTHQKVFELSVDGVQYRAVQGDSENDRWVERYDKSLSQWVRDDIFTIGDWIMFRQIVSRARITR